MTYNPQDRPLAAKGFTSYRCFTGHSWIMIGANSPDEAMKEARRSDEDADRAHLQVWNGSEYVPVPLDHYPPHNIQR